VNLPRHAELIYHSRQYVIANFVNMATFELGAPRTIWQILNIGQWPSKRTLISGQIVIKPEYFAVSDDNGESASVIE